VTDEGHNGTFERNERVEEQVNSDKKVGSFNV